MEGINEVEIKSTMEDLGNSHCVKRKHDEEKSKVESSWSLESKDGGGEIKGNKNVERRERENERN